MMDGENQYKAEGYGLQVRWGCCCGRGDYLSVVIAPSASWLAGLDINIGVPSCCWRYHKQLC
jgi:hypothetical protein